MILVLLAPVVAEDQPAKPHEPTERRRLSNALRFKPQKQNRQHRHRHLSLDSVCDMTQPQCGTGLECTCEETSGRRLFGAPAATDDAQSMACTCQPIPSPPPKPPPPKPPSPPPPTYDYGGGAGEVEAIAGTGAHEFIEGVGTSAAFQYPHGIAITPDGSQLIIGDTNGERIRALDLSTRQSSTLAGDGTAGYLEGVGTAARFDHPTGVDCTPDGVHAVVADHRNKKIRLVEIATGATSLLASHDEEFDGQVAVSPDGTWVAVGGYGSKKVRKIDMATGQTTILHDDGAVNIWGVAWTPSGLSVIFSSRDPGNQVRSVSSSGGTPSVVAGSGAEGFADGAKEVAQFNNPLGIAITKDGRYVIVNDWLGHRVRAVDLSTGQTTTLAGDGTNAYQAGIGAGARVTHPTGMAMSPDGSIIYITTTGDSRILKITVQAQG